MPEFKILKKGSDESPYVYLGTDIGRPSEGSTISTILKESYKNPDLTLVEYSVETWNDSFSPWKAEAVFDSPFNGRGDITLKWLLTECIPKVEGENRGNHIRYIAGYSLSGLFAMWAFMKSGKFKGVVSCSGSFWFPGWMEYFELNKDKIIAGNNIYLSLGIKEEKTRNTAMAAVGNNTREMAETLNGIDNITFTLEWNPGGHFTEPEKRTAKGIFKVLEI